MNRTLTMVALAVTLLVSVVWVPAAAAKPKIVAMTPIEGDANGTIGDQVAEALDGAELSVLCLLYTSDAADE